MKNALCNLVLAVFGVFLVSASASAAQWVGTHGTSAVLEYPTNTTGIFPRGWGLQFFEKPNVANWTHIPVTTSIGAQQVRYIWLQYYKQYGGASLSQVDIWNGGTKVQTVFPAGGAAGWNWVSLDLGSYKSFPYGLGISILAVPAPGLNTEFDIGSAYVLQQ